MLVYTIRDFYPSFMIDTIQFLQIDAENIEKMLGERLRLNGIGVWFN